MLCHLKDPVLSLPDHSLPVRDMGASLIGRISRKLYVVHILVFALFFPCLFFKTSFIVGVLFSTCLLQILHDFLKPQIK